MGPPTPAPLPDELVEEILLRIPPSDPVTLARAAVAQKRWWVLVAGDGFRRKYRALYHAAPMQGFFFDHDGDGFSTSFVSASSFRPRPRTDGLRLRLEDARHGRVLLRTYGEFIGSEVPGVFLVVWDPITGHRMDLPKPKGLFNDGYWKATVLCAAAAPAGSCDHLDCHRGHFIVVLYGNSPARSMLSSCVYSSQDGAWSKIIFDRHLGACVTFYSEFRAHVGNALYCRGFRNRILKYDLGTREFSLMEPPVMLSRDEFAASEHRHGGRAARTSSIASVYTSHISTGEELGWGGTKIIDLEKCGNYVPLTTTPSLIGFAGDIGLVFIRDGNNGILSVDIRSAQMKVVDKRLCISSIVPYINFCFCTPAMGVPSKDDQPSAASRDVQSCVAISLHRQGEIL